MAEFQEMLKVPKGFSVATDTGFKPIPAIGRTIPYKVYALENDGGLPTLYCADNHIVYSGGVPIFVKDILDKGVKNSSNLYLTPITVRDYFNGGVEEVGARVQETGVESVMYDLQVDSPDHRYYTNGVLSHNSIFLANEAAHYVKMGKNVLFLTCEMSAKKVIKRIGSNVLDIEMAQYDETSRNTELMRAKIEFAKQQAGVPFGRLFVKEYPTSTLTVNEIETIIMQTEATMGFKIHALVVDYLNILCDQKTKRADNTNTNTQLKNLCEDLRAVAVRQNLVCITATQTRRDGFDSPNLEVTSVADGVSVIYTADLILAIIQTQDMHDNNEYQLKLAKVREGAGKNSRMQLTVDYSHMRILDTGVATNETGHTETVQTGIETRKQQLIAPTEDTAPAPQVETRADDSVPNDYYSRNNLIPPNESFDLTEKDFANAGDFPELPW